MLGTAAEQGRAGQRNLDGQSEATPRPAAGMNCINRINRMVEAREQDTRRDETHQPSCMDETLSPVTGEGTATLWYAHASFSKDKKKKARRIYFGFASPVFTSSLPDHHRMHQERFMASHLTNFFKPALGPRHMSERLIQKTSYCTCARERESFTSAHAFQRNPSGKISFSLKACPDSSNPAACSKTAATSKIGI